MGLVIYESPFSPNFIPCIKWGLSEHWHDLTFGSQKWYILANFLSEYVTGSLLATTGMLAVAERIDLYKSTIK